MIVGLGVDVVECARLRRSIERFGERFAIRVFTPAERDYCEGMADPVPHYAVRFAAKEAARKALAHEDALGWHDVEVVRAPNGAVSLRFSGRAAEGAKRAGVTHAHVSLSHERTVAIAAVVLERAT